MLIPMRRKKSLWIAVTVGALAIVVLIAYGLWSAFTRSELGLVLLGDSPTAIPSSRLVANLSSEATDIIRESLGVLQSRNDPAGVAQALVLLQHRDPYIWFNAARYLGAMRRSEAVPYLIKGLRHYAWRAHGECATHLAALTGQNFGKDYQKWHDWWTQLNPSSDFNFDSDLGP
jgi:hypothetical protein